MSSIFMATFFRINQFLPAQIVLPKLLMGGWKVLPKPALEQMCTFVFNKLFASELNQGELDFLADKWVELEVADINVRLQISLIAQKLVCRKNNALVEKNNVCISGKMHAFSQLCAGKVDPDSLFFRRKLLITGDTELGLELKNFLDSVDNSKLPQISREFVEFYASLENVPSKLKPELATVETPLKVG